MTIGSPQPRVRALLAASVLLLSGLAGCSSGGSVKMGTGGSGGGQAGGSIGTSGTGGTGGQAGGTGTGGAGGQTTATKTNGQSCSGAAECISGFCADGVCCNSACTGICVTCSGDVPGTCLPAAVNSDPHNDCKDQGAASCGTDGNCDGTGACELYVAGVACQTAGCSGSTLLFAGRCDGAGTCKAPTSQPCTPYTCGTTGSCKTTCSMDSDCTGNNFCVNGSCGPKPPGASCSLDTDCQSTHCQQGVCCATTCTGTCKSCAVQGSAGTCINVPAGQDLLDQCAKQDPSTCQTDGFCDGKGACEIYASGTVCGTNTCTAGLATAAGKCDGAGTCGAGVTSMCNAYVCDTTGVCKTSCTVDTDCATSYFCLGGTCAKKSPGATCAADSDCTSSHCAQGVCCNNACNGTCMACNLTGSSGTCSVVPAGSDPLNQCADQKATNVCGTNGSCDGAGACQFYPAGTSCGNAASCTGSTLTLAQTCDGAGSCRAATTQMCDPFECGTGACKTTCTMASDCVSPNSCTNNSCGKLPPGAVCTLGSACQSGFCAQGVCCNTACTGTCMSCALTGTPGTCTPVPAGQAPSSASQCTASSATTCGLDGTCNGAGACRDYPTGTQCAAPICSGSTLTPAQTCNGTGTCQTVTAAPCSGSLICNTATACKTSCTATSDCISPYICSSGVCILKTPGTACTTAAECASGFCQQGVCCKSACTGTCMSCNVSSGSAGTCSPITAGTAPSPTTQCTDAGGTSCGTNGLCDGTGKCQLYGTGTQCAAGTCTGDTLTPARFCDGSGSCKTVTSTLCDPYACGASGACNTTCKVATDCTSPASCTIPSGQTTGSCGKLAIGSPCTAAAMCNSGFCAQTVCCNNACSGTCSSCNLSGTVGTCTSILAGQAPNPTTQCTDQGSASCGTNGLCNGSGACQKYPSGTQCAGGTCTSGSAVGPSTCNTSNVCTAPAPTNCTPYICGANACKTTCATSTDCVSPDICAAGACVPPVTLSIQLAERDLNATDAAVAPHFKIFNNGTNTVTLSQITLRYWYTEEGTDGVTVATTPIAQQASCDFAAISCTNVVMSFVQVTPAVTGANFYFLVGFTSGAGTLAPGANINDIEVRFNKTNFSSNYNELDDYSYLSTMTFTTTTKVTAYLNGALIYGTEPQ